MRCPIKCPMLLTGAVDVVGSVLVVVRQYSISCPVGEQMLPIQPVLLQLLHPLLEHFVLLGLYTNIVGDLGHLHTRTAMLYRY